MFQGSITALITPFKKGKLDERRLAEQVEFQVKNGTSGLVPCGTTGESPTLSPSEHMRVIEVTIKAVKGRIPVIAGTGSNSTAEAIELTKHAAKAGADAVLQVVPYYNKPTQKGLFLHFKAIAEKVNIPVILYNIPGRTGVSMEPETIAALAKLKNIVGLKEATGSLDQTSKVLGLTGKDFDVFSGDDILTLPIMSVGGRGVISVIANLMPREVADMCASFSRGNLDRARDIHYRLLPFMKAAFIETNPIPIKTAMKMAGMDSGEMRLPLCQMADANALKLKDVLKGLKIV